MYRRKVATNIHTIRKTQAEERNTFFVNLQYYYIYIIQYTAARLQPLHTMLEKHKPRIETHSL